MKIYEIYGKLFRFKKEEIFLFLITFFYLFIRVIFLNKIPTFLNLFILFFEMYLTISIYLGIKKCVYEEVFIFSEIFKNSLYLFPSTLLYILIIGIFGGIFYSIGLTLIEYIGKISSFYSFLIFFILIIWLSFPFYFLLLTLYSPLIIIAENEKVLSAIWKSVNFIKENLPFLICCFFPFLLLWIIFFTIEQKYDKIFLLSFFVSFIEILNVKLIFIVYKGVKNERNF